MSILINENTRVLVQGITGRDGSFHALAMRDYGAKIVGGVVPGKGGESVEGIPVFNTVAEAKEKTNANASVIFVPARFAAAAMNEAIDAALDIVVCITEGVPVLDMMKIYNRLKGTNTRLIGPNCPGIISPGKCKIGIMPGQIHKQGSIGVISRSGTLTYEVVYHLTKSGLGETTCIGIGGDPIVGSGFIDLLKLFHDDPETKGVALIGEIGGSEEEETAKFIKESFNKPVVAFIAGRTAPPGKRMGHAGAIISGGSGTAEAKIKAFEEAGVPVAAMPDQIPEIMQNLLKKRETKMDKHDALKTYPKEATLRNGQKVAMRLMTPADETALFEFFRALPEEDRLFLKEDVTDPNVIHRWAKNIDYNRAIPLIAICNDRIVADALLLMDIHGWSRHVGEFRLVVSPDYRGLGLGFILSKELFQLAISLNIEKVIAQTIEDHAAVIQILKAIGFDREAVLRDHVKDLHGKTHNLLIMSNEVKSIWKKMEDFIHDTYSDHSGYYRI